MISKIQQLYNMQCATMILKFIPKVLRVIYISSFPVLF